MFVFQAKCEAGQQPVTDENGKSTGLCEPCPMDHYKSQDDLDADTTAWKAECSACAGRSGYEGKDYTFGTGSTSPDQCMGEFTLYGVRQKLKGVMSDHFSSNCLNCSVLTLYLAGAKQNPL